LECYNLSQLMGSKKGWFFISSMPLAPSLLSASQSNRFRISSAGPLSFASLGIFSVFFHCKIF
jgi:hypothetical protein